MLFWLSVYIVYFVINTILVFTISVWVFQQEDFHVWQLDYEEIIFSFHIGHSLVILPRCQLVTPLVVTNLLYSCERFVAYTYMGEAENLLIHKMLQFAICVRVSVWSLSAWGICFSFFWLLVLKKTEKHFCHLWILNNFQWYCIQRPKRIVFHIY